jgi:4-hydroxybutyryl-CoA dehydratase/vinylacetyl-CoA-Delta-isomerase
VRSAEQYLDGLRDGREVYCRGERVEDVVAHPELGLAARHGALDFHGPSREHSPYYAIPRSPADLRARSALIEESTRRGRTLVVLIKEIGTDALFALDPATESSSAGPRSTPPTRRTSTS